jgi:hypothetical protein
MVLDLPSLDGVRRLVGDDMVKLYVIVRETECGLTEEAYV